MNDEGQERKIAPELILILVFFWSCEYSWELPKRGCLTYKQYTQHFYGEAWKYCSLYLPYLLLWSYYYKVLCPLYFHSRHTPNCSKVYIIMLNSGSCIYGKIIVLYYFWVHEVYRHLSVIIVMFIHFLYWGAFSGRPSFSWVWYMYVKIFFLFLQLVRFPRAYRVFSRREIFRPRKGLKGMMH